MNATERIREAELALGLESSELAARVRRRDDQLKRTLFENALLGSTEYSVPPSTLFDLVGRNLAVLEDAPGTLVLHAHDDNGDVVRSLDAIEWGSPAKVQEALRQLVDRRPDRDALLARAPTPSATQPIYGTAAELLAGTGRPVGGAVENEVSKIKERFELAKTGAITIQPAERIGMLSRLENLRIAAIPRPTRADHARELREVEAALERLPAGVSSAIARIGLSQRGHELRELLAKK
jgi:hypothetical protein